MIEEKNKKKKIKYLSIARGLGILLVVIGHCTPLMVNKYIYLFHMPMFFFISGFLSDFAEVKSMKHYALKKIKKLYFPYVLVNFIFLICRPVFYEIGFYQDGYLSVERINSVGEFFKDVGSIFVLTHMELISAPTWFVRVLLVATICCAIAFKIIKKVNLILVLSVIGFLGVYLLLSLNIQMNAVVLYSCLIVLAVFFMLFGYQVKKIEDRIIYSKVRVFIAIFLLVVLGQFGTIQMVELEIENPLYFLIAACLGIYVIFGISKFLENRKIGKVLEYFGNHTMIILCLHVFAFKLVSLIYGAHREDYSCLKQVYSAPNLLWTMLNIVAGVGVPLLLEWGYRKIKEILLNGSIKGDIS